MLEAAFNLKYNLGLRSECADLHCATPQNTHRTTPLLPPPLPAHTSTLYNCNRTQQNEETPSIPSPAHQAIAQDLNIIKIEMLFLGHRTVHTVLRNYSLGQLEFAWESTAQNVLYNISGFHKKDKKLKKTSSSRNPSWNSDTESSHRLTQTRLFVRNALMQCRGKKERISRKKMPLTHIWDGGSGRGCVARQCCTHAQKICQKNVQKWINQFRSDKCTGGFSDGKRTESGCHIKKMVTCPQIPFETAPYEKLVFPIRDISVRIRRPVPLTNGPCSFR